MKKFFIILLFNILAVGFILLLFEIYIYNFIFYPSNHLRFPQYKTQIDTNSFNLIINDRIKYSEESTQKPILLLGCSYTYGHGLTRDKTLGYKLANLTHRPIYVLSDLGYGPANILSTLFAEHNINILKEEPEYIFYTYMYDHINRTRPFNSTSLDFLREQGLLPGIKNSFADVFYTVKYYKYKKYEKYFNSLSFQESWIICENYFLAINKKLKEIFPHAKFVILVYSDSPNDLNSRHESMDEFQFSLVTNKSHWQKIIDSGMTVILTKELTGRIMDKPEDRVRPDFAITPHPSSAAWDEIVPLLIKKYNL